MLSDEQLIVLTKKMRHLMWNWHIYIGYIIAGLFCIRFFLPATEQLKFQNPLGKNLSIKEKLKK